MGYSEYKRVPLRNKRKRTIDGYNTIDAQNKYDK